MKCIKVIKESKHYQLGEIRRVEDQDAYEKVASGVWKFVPKSDWKAVSRKPKSEPKVETENEANTIEVKKQKRVKTKKS